MSTERLQPLRERHVNPDAEDEGYDRIRQRELDEQIARDEARQAAEDKAVASAAKVIGVTGGAAETALRTLYRFGVMDGLLR